MAIGLQKTSYTVTEENTVVLMCTEVVSGSIAGRTITVNYQTANNGAEGIYRQLIFVSDMTIWLLPSQL